MKKNETTDEQNICVVLCFAPCFVTHEKSRNCINTDCQIVVCEYKLGQVQAVAPLPQQSEKQDAGLHICIIK
jgi:hypothetical protein